MTTRTRFTLAAAALIAGLALAACGTAPASSSADDTTDYSTTATVAPDDPTPAPSLDRRELTRMSIDITWDASTPADQQSMCNGITMFGTDWAAAQLRKGGDSDVLDWDYAAQIIQGKCGL